LLDPGGMTIDNSGNIYVAEYTAYTIRKITPSAVVTTVAGLLLHQGSTDGTGSAARFNDPTSVAVDAAGNLFVADRGNHLIRKITPAGVVTTIAGNGTAGYANGQGSAASFNDLEAIVIDKDGYLYVTDTNMIRKITPDGTVSVFAGQQSHGSADGPAATASFFNCRGLTMDPLGNFYVSDSSNNLIRKISLQ